jgi:ribosomal protein S6--L-glutamate ligase
VKLKAALLSLGSQSSEWTYDAMKRYFGVVDSLDIRKIDIKISGREQEILYDGKPLATYDCIYVKGSFRYAQLLKTLTSLLEKKCYMPLSADSFTVAHDKLLTHLELQKHSIPMPRTYITATVPAAKKVLESLNGPVMMKFPHGTGGKGVMYADSYASASSLLDALSALRQPFILQEYIETDGTDLRIIVIGNKVVASMKRKAGFMEARANFHSGGTGVAFEPDQATKRLAIDVARAIKAEICAVDILPSSRGPLVIEANISPGLQLISKVTKVDVADAIAKHLFERTVEMKNRQAELHTIQMMTDLEAKKGAEQKIITNLTFRGSTIILPEAVTKYTEFGQTDTYEITADQDKITIKKMKIK